MEDSTPSFGFLPMLWPKGEIELKTRVIVAVILVLAGKAAVLVMPFAYKAVIDRMSGPAVAAGVVTGFVAAYATARFAGVLADNLRNALFEKVGQGAARRLSRQVFRHIHDLSLRFHLERRTGSLDQDRRARNEEHRHDALLPPLQHCPDGHRAGRDLRHLLRQIRRRTGRRDPCNGGDLHRLHAQGHGLARADPARHERGRQQGDRPRGRFPAQLRDRQIFRCRGARG